MEEELIPNEERFYSKEVFTKMEYFQEGLQFTSKKEILSIINNLFQSSKEVCISKGSIIYTQGERADYAYFLVQGSVLLLSPLSDNKMSELKCQVRKISELQKKQMIASQLGIKAKDIKFNVSELSFGNILNHRVFSKIVGKACFGISEMLKSGIRPFTSVATSNIKVLMVYKKQFESVCSSYQQKRQDNIISPMYKQFTSIRGGRQFLFAVFPSSIKKKCGFNEILYNEGDSPFAVYFICKGQFQIYKKKDNKNENVDWKGLRNSKVIKDDCVPIRKKSAGEFIGMEEVVLNLKKREFKAKSNQESTVYKIEAQKFLQLLYEYFEVKQILTKYSHDLHEGNKKYYLKVAENINKGFRVKEQTNHEDEQKLGKSIHRQIFSGMVNKNKNKSNNRLKGHSLNILCNPYDLDEKASRKSFAPLNIEEYIPTDNSHHSTLEKSRAKSVDVRKIMDVGAQQNNIKIDQKAHKRVMIKLGTYNSKSKKQIFRVGSQFKNSFQPIIDEIVRRHNTFLTKLDPKKRRQFVTSKYKATVQEEIKSKSIDKQSTMYKTWTVRSMKRSMKKYQETIDLPFFKDGQKKQGHKQIMARFQSLVCPSSIPGSRTSRKERQRSPELSNRGSSGNKIVLLNHMMKPMVYFQNN